MFSCFHGIEVESDIQILSFYLQIAFDRKAEAQYSVMDQVGAFSCVNLRIFIVGSEHTCSAGAFSPITIILVNDFI